MASYPYVLVGQGLAGTFLSMRLQEQNIDHLVIDDPSLSQSSRIAAGIANPVVLKRLKWVKDAEKYLESLEDFYQEWEFKLAENIYHPFQLKHIFHSQGQVNDWMEHSEKPPFRHHLGPVHQKVPDYIDAPHGYGLLENVAWLDTELMITTYRTELKKKERLREHSMTPELIERIQQGEEEIKAEKIVICNGHLARQLWPQTKELFRPTRGEVMVIESDELREEAAWHAGVFILPLGKQRFKVGATYAHDELEDRTTKQGLKQLKDKLSKFFRGAYEIKEHLAGVRPTTKDRQPLMGQLEDGLFLFNGFGSRGTLMGPYLSQRMLEYLEEAKELPENCQVERFTSD